MTSPPEVRPQGDAALLRALLDGSELLIMTFDRDGRVLLFNRACEQLSATTADRVAGQVAWETLFPAGERARVKALFEAVREDRPRVDFDSYWEHPDGQHRWVHWRFMPLDRAAGTVLATGLELTARKIVESTLRQSEQELRLLFDNLPELAAFLDRDLRYRLASRSHQNWFGLDAGALWGMPLADVMGREAEAILRPYCDEALAGTPATWVGEIPFSRGGARFVHGTFLAHRTPAGEADGVFLLFTDLTEHRLMQRALDAATRRAQAVLDTAVDGIITIDEHGIIESFNPGASKLFGYRPEEAIGQNVSILMPEPDASRHDGYLRRYLETGERHIIGIGREVTGKRKDGSLFPLDLAVGEFIEDGRHFFTAFTKDASARKAAELEARRRFDQLAHVTRLSSMGNLASGIAHEVNQPLTAIVTMAHAVLRNLKSGRSDPALVGEALQKIAQQGERASAIIQHMREFIGKDASRERVMRDPAAIVRGVVDLLTPELRQHGVTLNMDLDAEACVEVSVIQVEQVLVNLIQNAIHAMLENSGERRLTITGRRDDPSGYFLIRVADNGCGLPDGDARRVFEAFFTTKRDGMGQGLSISRSIVLSHGGTMWAAPNEGRGAVFSFTLPLCGKPA